ncbi:MAG: hypothetical protein RSF90_02660 [Pygmaiobacter sp.]
MTKEEWQLCADKVTRSFWGGCRLQIDGYEVTLQLQRITAYKNMIMIYINGKFQGRWISEDCEERRRFMYCKSTTLMSRKQIQEFNKLSKASQKALKEYRDKTYTSYSPQFPSFSALKKQLIANNNVIELLPDQI